MIERYVLGLEEIDKTQVALAGGKGANLGELSRIEGIRVPAGFCVTTDAFRRIMTTAPGIDASLDRLARLDPGDRQAIRALSAEIRRTMEGIAVPDDLAAAIDRSVSRLDEDAAYAVRSSATAEDLPTASFAGQQDTYLNVVGLAAILEHVSRCWASLFTERAVTYRLRNGFDHRKVHMAVVVQRMVFPQAAGILFTADPVTANRKVVSIEASFGLGEALVAGLVNPDVYQVRDGEIVAKAVAAKQLAIYALPAGGTRELAIEPASQEQPALTDAQIVRLAQLGRRIEAHFGQPQDIEWCLVDDELQIVQSRPITTLFPIPATSDQGNHVYISVGHQQMMTDAMKPLGLSVWRLTTPRPMAEAGGRLFVDVTKLLGSAPGPRVDGEPFGGDGLGDDVTAAHLIDVRVHQARDQGLAETEAGLDGDDLAVGGDRVGREDDPGRLREDHLLDDHRHLRLPVVEAAPQPVGHRPLGEQRGPAPADVREDLGRADDVQVGVLLSGEGGRRQVLRRRAGSDGVGRLAAKPVDRAGDRRRQVVGDDDPLDDPADLGAERGDHLPVVGVQPRQPAERLIDQRRRRGHDPPERVRRHAEASRNANALDPPELAQVRALAPDKRALRLVDLVEAQHVSVGHRTTSRNETQLSERTVATVIGEAESRRRRRTDRRTATPA